MNKKTYQTPKIRHIEVLAETLIALSSQGSEPTGGVETGTDIEFETKKNSDTQWSDMW
ncbi:MAG: hypothetical protein ACI4B5_08560 [Bacteroidaceae bacterium]